MKFYKEYFIGEFKHDVRIYFFISSMEESFLQFLFSSIGENIFLFDKLVIGSEQQQKLK